MYIKGRGSQIDPANRFLKHHVEKDVEHLATEEEREAELFKNPKTKYLEVFPKTILNKVDSPDLMLAWSMNPYQGCEHGCIYCYARNTHEYWGYSAGHEFEENILLKKNAPVLLREKLLSKSWKGEPIMLAGNTDCYQPAERKLEITRGCLQVFQELKHPIGIITKNSLIERDMDILGPMAAEHMAGVVLSLTTLDEKLKRVMEPRTSSVYSVLRTIEKLTKAGIPVSVNMAPIIPALNHEEIFELVRTVADAGALGVNYTIVRLNGHNGKIFEDWITKNLPDRANKVLNQIKSMHGGKLNDSNWGRRMRGEGKFAELIKSQFKLASAKYLNGRERPEADFSKFEEQKRKRLEAEKRGPQMSLFD